MAGIDKNTYVFLKELAKNNDKEWFAKNKPRYEAAKANFVEYLDTLIPEIAKFDKSVATLEGKKCVFRIYRDTRFSKDKTPYKVHLGAHLIAGGSKAVHERAGYYIHLEPGNNLLAGGAYLPPSQWIKKIRSEISYNAAEFKKILNNESFKEHFGEMEGEKLKTAPKDYSKDHPEIDLLRYKSFLASHSFNEKQATSDDFLQYSTKVFKALEPFDAFLNMSRD